MVNRFDNTVDNSHNFAVDIDKLVNQSKDLTVSRIKILQLVGGYIIGNCKSKNIRIKLNKIIFVGACYGCFVIAVCG